jgi:hypothetical protein
MFGFLPPGVPLMEHPAAFKVNSSREDGTMISDLALSQGTDEGLGRGRIDAAVT